MKYLKIILDPIKIKGDPEDPEQLQHDLFEKIQAMVEAETLSFSIDEEDDDTDED
jgi:hypothetical protein